LVWVAGGQYGLATKAVYKISMQKSQTYKGVDTGRIKNSNIKIKIQIDYVLYTTGMSHLKIKFGLPTTR
jgi:hypothetical protein